MLSLQKSDFLPFNRYKGGPFTAKELEALRLDGLELGPSFDRQDIGKYQIAGSDKTGTPKALQGIWWMDGNPVGDETLSFAEVDFTSANPLFPVYGVNNFSYQGGDPSAEAKKTDIGRDYGQGEQAFHMARLTSALYEFSFKTLDSEPYGFATMLPILGIRAAGFEERFSISQNIFTFTLRRVHADYYERETEINGKVNAGYQLKRILIPDSANPDKLNPTTYWEEFVGQKRPAKLRLVVRKS
jgi:hypothetical protein